MTIHWKDLEVHFLMVPGTILLSRPLSGDAFSDFFSQKKLQLKELS
jgi:hypothetical protein